MKRYGICIILTFLLVVGTGCADSDNVPSPVAETEAAVEDVIDHDALRQTLKKTTVVLSMPNGVYEYDLWSMGMRIDPDGNRYYDPTLLNRFCTRLCSMSAILPIDASAAYSGGEEPFSFTADTDGRAVDAEHMASLLSGMSYDADAYSVAVPAEATEADITVDQLQQERQLLASYTTSFNKSPLNNKNRVFNIKKAADMINGKTVLPGETFSMNRTIGDRNKKNGWKTASAITGGKYTKEYGGGVCQVSSTLFNVVLMADLEIVERYHHSWPMSYVPIGRDATISTGSKDFIFRNSTASDIVISAQVNTSANKLTVSLYGTPSDKYAYIELESERTGSVDSKGEKRILDESLPNNTRVVERKARTGRKSVTYQCYYDGNGKLLERKVAFRDTYPSIQGIVYLSSDLYY